MLRIGTPELVIVLVIVMLIFGVGRLGKMGRDLGEGIREFRNALGKQAKAEESTEGA